MLYCPYAKAAYIQGLVARGENIHNIGAIHLAKDKTEEYPARQALECMTEQCGMYSQCLNPQRLTT